MRRDLPPSLFKTLYRFEGSAQQLTHLFLCLSQIVPGFCKFFFADHKAKLNITDGCVNTTQEIIRRNLLENNQNTGTDKSLFLKYDDKSFLLFLMVHLYGSKSI